MEISTETATEMAKLVCDETKEIKDIPAKVERCVLSVKKDLRKRHPDWSYDKIKTSAYKICNSKIK